MKKNVIFLIAVKNKDFEEKYGGFGWFEYAIKSWTYWCERNNAELVIYEIGFKDMDNLNWIYESVQGYKEFFNGFNFNINKYVNSNIIFNKTHKNFFKEFEKFYYENHETIFKLENEIVKKGTDQTPLNYFIQKNNMDVNMSIPWIYNVTHPHRKELFSHNWQLDEDKTPFFIKYGYHWKFSGMAKDARTSLMKQTWDLIGNKYQ